MNYNFIDIYSPKKFSKWLKIHYRCNKESEYWNIYNEYDNKRHLLTYKKIKNSNEKIIFLIYSNLELDNFVIEKTKVNIDKIDKDQIWLTAETSYNYIFKLYNTDNKKYIYYLDNEVKINYQNDKIDNMFFNYDNNINETFLSKNKKKIYNIENTEIKYISEFEKISDNDYLHLIQIIKLLYNITFEKRKENYNKTIIWYEYNFNLNIDNIINCTKYNLNYFEKFLNIYEYNSVYKEYLINKINRIENLLNKDSDLIFLENTICILKDICIKYYCNNNNIIIIEEDWNNLMELQKYEEIIYNIDNDYISIKKDENDNCHENE